MEPKIIEITQDIKTFYVHTYDVPNGIPALFNELEKRVDEFAPLITQEMGKPLAEAQAEVKKAASGARNPSS